MGDFVYSRAFQMMATVGSQRVMEIMADATNAIASGEVLQLMNSHDPDTTEQRYLEVIYRKTGRLFEAGAEVAAVLAGARRQQAALTRYGKHLGTAYQLVDDALDYRGTRTTRGKNLGDDLAEGKPTLPLLHALQHGDAGTAAHHSPGHRTGRDRATGADRRGRRGHRRPRLHRATRGERSARRPRAHWRRAGLALSRCARGTRPFRRQSQQLETESLHKHPPVADDEARLEEHRAVG